MITHPQFHALLQAFGRRTGLPVVVNTSFNVRGEPIFATPRAGQDVDVSVLANDVETTQSAEIALMRQMLAALRDPSSGAR